MFSSIFFFLDISCNELLIGQVEVKIDNSQADCKDSSPELVIEAKLYDTSCWYDQEGMILLSSHACDLKFTHSFSATQGCHDYVLQGKLEQPRLWSAEQARKPCYSFQSMTAEVHLA